MKTGVGNFLNLQPLLESVIPAGYTQPSIIAVLHKYLDKLAIDSELIIIDPFLFANTRITNYADFVTDVFRPYLPAVRSVIFITTDIQAKINATIKADIENKFRAVKPTLITRHSLTGDIHDRYIFSHSREKGVVLGTSLNGFGNKLALIDRLNTSDVLEIISELIAMALI
jgi:hypothetical protein